MIKGIGNVPAQRDLIIVGSSENANWTKVKEGIVTDVVSPFVPAGSRTIAVSDLTHFSVGDQVVITHPSTSNWLASIDFGGTASDAPWKPGNLDLRFLRRIKAVYPSTKKVVLDIPIYDHLDLNLATSRMHRWNDIGIIRNCGVEDLHIEVITDGPLSENHAWTAVFLDGVENCWVTGIVSEHFSYAAVNMVVANQVTVRDCEGLDPHSEITGARRYNFAVNRQSNNILFQRCHATHGRHSFVSNGANEASNIVWHDCTSESDHTSSEGHRRWSQALLFDNITFRLPETGKLLGLYNRGNFGTGHGWSAVHSVAWNIKMPFDGKLIIQKPPGRQNYGIGGQGIITGVGNFLHDRGYIELPRTEPTPPSLYLAQLEQRLTQGPSPDVPARPSMVELSADSILFEWLDISAEEMGYRIEISLDTGRSFTKIATLPADTEHWIWSADSPSRSTFRISTLGNNCDSYSRHFTLGTSTSSSQVDHPYLKIFPNPTARYINLQSSERIRDLQIIDLTGQVLYQQDGLNTQSHIVDLTSFLPNVYFIKVSFYNGAVRQERFLLQR